ncbi:MAG: hypothetical protein IPL88_14700 [Rhizobiales bacterium]|nr:hypothetical protein [Hyphomicrobiales bacterium]
MSLTEDITGLVARATDLIDKFDAKKTGIDAAVAAAVAAVPGMLRVVYIDQAAGADANDGLTDAAPVKTLAKAVALVGPGRAGDFRFLSNYLFDAARVALPVNITLQMRSWGGVRRRLTLQVLPSADGVTQEVTGFYAANYGTVQISVYDLDLAFPATPVGGTMAVDRYNAFLKTGQSQGPLRIAIEYSTGEIVRPADGVGLMVSGAEKRPVHLGVQFATYPAAMAGKWLQGVASGVSPDTLKWLTTNLTSL